MLLRRRHRGEDGAVAVEAALIMLPLFMIIIGILEMSFLMRGVTAASSAVAAGARSSSVSAAAGTCNNSTSTCTVNGAPNLGEVTAKAIERSGTALSSSEVLWVMVYAADANGMPAGQSTDFDPTKCQTTCLLYRLEAGKLKFQSSSSWDTRQINACVNDTRRGAVGVAIRVKHHWFTGFFGDSYSFTQHNVMQFEPLPTDSCAGGAHT